MGPSTTHCSVLTSIPGDPFPLLTEPVSLPHNSPFPEYIVQQHNINGWSYIPIHLYSLSTMNHIYEISEKFPHVHCQYWSQRFSQVSRMEIQTWSCDHSCSSRGARPLQSKVSLPVEFQYSSTNGVVSMKKNSTNFSHSPATQQLQKSNTATVLQNTDARNLEPQWNCTGVVLLDLIIRWAVCT